MLGKANLLIESQRLEFDSTRDLESKLSESQTIQLIQVERNIARQYGVRLL